MTVHPKMHDTLCRRVFLELSHARIRLALAANEIAWAQELLQNGEVKPKGALQILDEAMDRLCGGAL